MNGCCVLLGASVSSPQTKELLKCHPKCDIETLISASSSKEAEKFDAMRAHALPKPPPALGLTDGEYSGLSFGRWELFSISFYPLQNAPVSLPPFFPPPPFLFIKLEFFQTLLWACKKTLLCKFALCVGSPLFKQHCELAGEGWKEGELGGRI